MTRRPNILFIMADQHRFDYLGSAGAPFVRTPNLDRLAARGVRFANCFTNSPVCAPARIGLATGIDPMRSGALDNESFLRPEAVTYYMRLRDHGYRVGCVGKLDLAKPDTYNGRHGDRPCVFRWGFTHPEEVEGKEHSLKYPQPKGPYGFWLQEKGLYEAYHRERVSHKGFAKLCCPSELPTETFLDCYQGRRAVEWIRRVPEDFPWHYFVSFSGPHSPHDPPKEYFARFAEAAMPEAVAPPEPGAAPCRRAHRLEGAFLADVRRAYCAYITLIDEWVGRILEALEARGMAENTWVFYSADHGEMLGDLGLFGKSVPYEPSMHVPLLAAGPGSARGAVCRAMVEMSDLNPTICRLAGLPAQPGIDARSFHECLADPDAPHRSEIVSALRRWRCIRTARHKLVHNWNAASEFYDLEDDPGERHNLAEADRPPPAPGDAMERRLYAREAASPHGGPHA